MLARPILFADDDADDVYMFWRFHKECRIQNPVEVFLDGEDVVRYFQASRLNYALPAVLLVDLKMPRLSGLEVLEYLNSSGQRGFPTVVLTGNEDMNLTTRAHELGAHSVVTKPLEKPAFCKLMSSLAGVSMEGYVEESKLEGGRLSLEEAIQRFIRPPD